MSTDRGIRSSRFALSCVASVALLLSTHGAAVGAFTATIVDNVDDVHSVTVAPTKDFSVQIQLTGAVAMTGLQARLLDVSSSGFFTLSSVVFGSDWSQAPGEQVNPTNPVVNPSPPPDFTYTPVPLNNSLVLGDVAAGELTDTGNFLFATLNFTVSSGAIVGNTYDLNLADIVYGNADYEDVYGEFSGGAYHVEIVPVPAPGALVLGIIGLGMVRWAKRWAGHVC